MGKERRREKEWKEGEVRGNGANLHSLKCDGEELVFF